MSRDASLTEFGVGGDGDATGEATDETDESTVAADTDEGEATAQPEPVRPTSHWTGDPTPCPDCGTAVQRTWRADGRFVCADCKTW